jgi:AraC-like DNA-binding protein
MASIEWPLTALPEITVAGRFPLADRGFSTTYRGATHALHLHDYAGHMRLAGTVVALAPGDLTISPAGEPSAYDLNSAGSHWCIHFAHHQSTIDPLVLLPIHQPMASATTAARERMAHIVRLHARAGESRIARASASLALQELLLWLTERAAPALRDSAAEHAAAIIDERFHEPLTIPTIATEVGRSQNHLARIFRARFGVTISHRIIERRAAHARYLLEATDLPIWRVAERVGIPDPHHFNKTVRKLLGASPSAIRAGAGRGAIIDPDR